MDCSDENSRAFREHASSQRAWRRVSFFDSLVHIFTGLSYCDCVALRIDLTPDIYLFYGEYSSAIIKRLMMLHYILGRKSPGAAHRLDLYLLG